MHLGSSNLGEKREPNQNPFELILFQNKMKKGVLRPISWVVWVVLFVQK
jgi:hypothetical protein